jgi:hypothetical protein
MKLVFDEHNLGTGTEGLEISVKGFKSNPTDHESDPIQVYIEVYEGKLQVHTWDGSSEDPASVKIDPRTEAAEYMVIVESEEYSPETHGPYDSLAGAQAAIARVKESAAKLGDGVERRYSIEIGS